MIGAFTGFCMDIQMDFVVTLPVILLVCFPSTFLALECQRRFVNIRFFIVLFLLLLVLAILMVLHGYGQRGSFLLQNTRWWTIVENTTVLFLFLWLDERRIDFKFFLLILVATSIIFWIISLPLSLVQRHHGTSKQYDCQSRLYNKQPPIGFSAVAHCLWPFSGHIQCELSWSFEHSYPWVWQ